MHRTLRGVRYPGIGDTTRGSGTGTVGHLDAGIRRCIGEGGNYPPGGIGERQATMIVLAGIGGGLLPRAEASDRTADTPFERTLFLGAHPGLRSPTPGPARS